jgi:oligopeptide/dipeptide ABC transporter ATP-binding protein
VSFELAPGEVLGIVGESGSGKSTLLMSILRLLHANATVTAGSIYFDGVNLLALSEREMQAMRGSEISLVPQRPMTSLSPVSTIQRQLVRYLDRRIWGQADSDAAIATMLDRVGLRAVSERIGGWPHQFSGGQLQRILIAIASMSARPRVLLADEPTSTLDPTVQAQVLRVLGELRTELGIAIILVTHDLGVVAQVCDRVAVMYAGEIVEVGTGEAIFADPQHPYTRALLNAMPSRHPRRARMPTIEGSVADLAAEIRGCPFAPRCPNVMNQCWEVAPAPSQAGASTVRCHLYLPTVQ